MCVKNLIIIFWQRFDFNPKYQCQNTVTKYYLMDYWTHTNKNELYTGCIRASYITNLYTANEFYTALGEF